MKKLKALMLGAACVWSIAIAEPHSPVGYWLQISDATGKPQSIMQVYAGQKGDQNCPESTFCGKVVTGFLQNGQAPQRTCVNCPGNFKDKPILGMQIMWGFRSDGDEWFGHILDPNRGSTYHCVLSLRDDGAKLRVRGYIGIPLFGRTQIWHHLTPAQAVNLSRKGDVDKSILDAKPLS